MLRNKRIITWVMTVSILSAAAAILCADEFIYDAKGKRNPFVPLVTPDGRMLKLDQEEGVREFSIAGIIYDEYGQSYAIVNDGVVKVGDRVGDSQVLKIEKNRIIFIKDGEPFEVEFKREEK